MFETAVAGSGTGIVDAVGAGTAHANAGIADVGIDGGRFGGLEVALEVEVVTGVGASAHDGVVVHMGVTEGPVHAVGASRDGEVGAEGGTGTAEDGVDPVVRRHVAVEAEVGEGAEVRVVVAGEVASDGTELILELHEVLGVHRLDGAAVGHGLETVVGVELDGELGALLGALGRHDDDAVGASGTVDGGRESVLQHVDGGDFGGGDVIDGLYRETVDDVERGAVLSDGTAAAHANLDIRVRVAFRRDDGDTGHLTGESLGHGGHGLLGELVSAHGGNGAEEVAALDRRITDHDDFVEERLVRGQDHVDLSAALDGDHLIGEADEREHQIDCVVRDGDRIIAVKTGGNADGSAFHEDAGPDQGLAALVGHNTGNGILAVEAHRRHHAEQCKKEFLCFHGVLVKS